MIVIYVMVILPPDLSATIKTDHTVGRANLQDTILVTW